MRRERERGRQRVRTHSKGSCISIIAILRSEQWLQNSERRFQLRILYPFKLAVKYEGTE